MTRPVAGGSPASFTTTRFRPEEPEEAAEPEEAGPSSAVPLRWLPSNPNTINYRKRPSDQLWWSKKLHKKNPAVNTSLCHPEVTEQCLLVSPFFSLFQLIATISFVNVVQPTKYLCWFHSCQKRFWICLSLLCGSMASFFPYLTQSRWV